jgi:hypothetical protein
MKIKGISVNSRVTPEVILEACERGMTSLDSPGFCILCGCEVEGVEPDARGYPCEACGAETTVYGAEELLIRMA